MITQRRMPELPCDISTIGEEHLDALISDKIPESLTLEYKQRLDLKSKEGTHKLIRVVVSFANAKGGHVVCGVNENEKGLPNELVGIEMHNIDQYTVAIHQKIESLIEPAISPPPSIHSISLRNGKHALILYVPNSTSSPHVCKTRSGFYQRVGARCSPMSIRKIKLAFEGAENMRRRIRQIHENGVQSIVNGEPPIDLETTESAIIVHFIPECSLESSSQLEMALIRNQRLDPLGGDSYSNKACLQGWITHPGSEGILPTSYCLRRIDGVVETVNTRLVQVPEQDVEQPDGRVTRGVRPFYASHFEKTLIKWVDECRHYFDAVRVDPPYYLYLTLEGVKGRVVVPEPLSLIWAVLREQCFRDDTLQFNPVVLERRTKPTPEFLKPMFDQVWNAAGWDESPNYPNREYVEPSRT